MSKLIAWSAGVEDEPAPEPETRVFTHPSVPGVEFPLTLVEPGLMEEGDIQDVYHHFLATYLPPGKPPKLLLTPDGKEHRLNRAAIDEVSTLYAMQGGPEAARYRWEELADIYVRRKLAPLWRQASNWGAEVLERARARLGNPPAGSGAPSSKPASSTDSNPPDASAGETAASTQSPCC